MDKSARAVLKQPAVWILGVFAVLVVAEILFAAAGMTFPAGFTGSILYPVLLVLLAYSVVFRDTDHYRNFKALLTAFTFGAVVASVFILSKSPRLFDVLAGEDRFVEALSAAALFIGAALFLILAIGAGRRRTVVAALVAGFCALVLFIVGMEEISWMQRILRFETTDFFLERNIQNEMNLHNFNTGVSERLYYFGGFVTMILLPYFHGPVTTFLRNMKRPELAALLPEPWVLVPSSLMVGYVGTSVLGDPTATIAFIVTALILFRAALEWLEAGNLPKFIVYGTFLVVMCGMTYYFTTYDYASVAIRTSARKEYLELVLALGLMAWAASALRQSIDLAGFAAERKDCPGGEAALSD